jgi:hypothetical protein
MDRKVKKESKQLSSSPEVLDKKEVFEATKPLLQAYYPALPKVYNLFIGQQMSAGKNETFSPATTHVPQNNHRNTPITKYHKGTVFSAAVSAKQCLSSTSGTALGAIMTYVMHTTAVMYASRSPQT